MKYSNSLLTKDEVRQVPCPVCPAQKHDKCLRKDHGSWTEQEANHRERVQAARAARR